MSRGKPTLIWVESPAGKREQQTALNARDLVNNAGWKVVGGSGPNSKLAPTPTPAPADVDDDGDDDQEDEQDDDEGHSTTDDNAADATHRAPSPVDWQQKVQEELAGLNKNELIAYAEKNFSERLDARKTEAKLRAEIMGLASVKNGG